MNSSPKEENSIKSCNFFEELKNDKSMNCYKFCYTKMRNEVKNLYGITTHLKSIWIPFKCKETTFN